MSRHIRSTLEAGDVSARTSPFRYREASTIAAVTRRRAVLRRGNVEISGVMLWALRAFAHLVRSDGARRRLTMITTWCWSGRGRYRGQLRMTEQQIDARNALSRVRTTSDYAAGAT